MTGCKSILVFPRREPVRLEQGPATSGSSATIRILPLCIALNQPFSQDLRLACRKHVHGLEFVDPLQPARGHFRVAVRGDVPEQLQIAVCFAQVFFQLPVIGKELRSLKGLLREDGDLLVLKRLGQVIVSPFLDCFEGRVEGTEGREKDDGYVGIAPGGVLEHFDPVRAGHHKVGDDQVEVFDPEPADRLQAVADRSYGVAFPGEKGGNDIAHDFVIVRNKYFKILFIHKVSSVLS